MRGRRFIYLVIISMIGAEALAQLPSTDIYTLTLRANEEKVLLSDPSYISSFNVGGYNNQPLFVDHNTVLITSNYEALGLTDIYQLDLSTKRITRITATEESEYSPTVMPNGMNFSVIRQELDDSPEVPQVLWSYPLNRENAGHLEVDLTNIGYQCWLSETKIALFLVGEPHELVIYDTQKKTSEHVAYDVGRSLRTDKHGDLYYVHKIASSWNIRKYDMSLGRSSLVTRAIEGQEDFDILPNGWLISSEGTELMTFDPGKDRTWQSALDLKGAGITSISRIASTTDKIAIVTSR